MENPKTEGPKQSPKQTTTTERKQETRKQDNKKLLSPKAGTATSSPTPDSVPLK